MLLLRRAILPSLLVAAILVSLLSWAFPNQAHAQTAPPNQAAVENGSYRFINRGHIVGRINGVDYDFIDSNVNTHPSEFVTSQSPCNQGGRRITLGSGASGEGIQVTYAQGGSQPMARGTIDMDVGPACSNTNPNTFEVTINATYANSWLYWRDAMTLVFIGGPNNPEHYFVRSSPDSPVFVQQGVSECADKVILSGTQGARLYRLDKGSGQNWNAVPSERVSLLQPDACKFWNGGNGDIAVQLIARPENSTVPVGDNVIPGGGGQGSNQEADNSCESVGALGWIICPVILATDSALNWIDTQIQGLLAMDENRYTHPGLKRAWTQIRNIAYIILIPIMLVMVIGTALGFEVFSAYTIKRALPRMVIAIIFITLSWYITTFLIGFFNVLGAGVLGIITSPFDFNGNAVSTLSLADLFATNGGSFWQTVLAQGAITIGIAVVIWLFLGPLALIVLTAFLILFLREMFIIVLALLAPLAILAWIFPGNDKLWKGWWSAFSKLLMMFPIIMGVIAIGRVFAAIVAGPVDDGGIDNWFLTPLFILAAYILPYAFIPFTFKMAGGMFATITGMAQDKEKGMFAKMKETRANKRQRAKDEGIFRGGNAGNLRGRFNNMYRRGANAKQGGLSMTRRGRSRWDESNMKGLEATADEKLKDGSAARAYNDDDASELLAQEGMTRNDFVRQYMANTGRSRADAEDALNRAEQAIGYKVGSKQMAASATKFRIAASNTAYDAGEAGLAQMQQDIQRGIAAGHFTAVDAAGWMKANRGRADYSSNGFNETIQFAAGEATAGQQLAGAFHGADPRDVLGSHQRTVEGFAQQAQVNLSDALASGDQTLIDKAMADVANIHTTLSSVSPRKGEEWANEVFAAPTGITLTRAARDTNGQVITREVTDPATGKKRQEAVTEEFDATVRQYLDVVRSDEYNHPDFHNRVREYSSARDAHLAGAAADAAAPPPDPSGGTPGGGS